MKKTIRDLDLKGKRVLIRVDFNVPLDEGKITDDTRIRASLPTIAYAIEKGAKKVILMSHLGRPKGKPNPGMSLKPCAVRLGELLSREVTQCPDSIGPETEKTISLLGEGEIAMLENLRFHSEEEKNDADFAGKLAKHADLYVNDAFGTSHRAHASVEGITKSLPSVAGFLLEKEIKYLGDAIRNPRKPFVAILGGSKVSDKIGMVENLIGKVDAILIGGAMAYTFLKVKGIEVGKSRVEEDKLDLARDILKKAEAGKVNIVLPVDHVTVKDPKDTSSIDISRSSIAEGKMGVDIGPETCKKFSEILSKARTVIWNGPMGIFEMKDFSHGSQAVADQLAENKDATTIIGGGDTAACVTQLGLAGKMSHISTGGGASLEYLEGRKLPGVEALADALVNKSL